MNDIADDFVSFYNSVRSHSKLGNLPLNAFEQKSANNQLINVCEKCAKKLDHDQRQFAAHKL